MIVLRRLVQRSRIRFVRMGLEQLLRPKPGTWASNLRGWNLQGTVNFLDMQPTKVAKAENWAWYGSPVLFSTFYRMCCTPKYAV